jgi:alkylhydroperoxidase family enzyme
MWVEQGPMGHRLENVLACHSLNEAALRAHLGLYRTIMFGPSPLTRPEREAIAVAVSAANDCHY